MDIVVRNDVFTEHPNIILLEESIDLVGSSAGSSSPLRGHSPTSLASMLALT